jgi:hypothetical protein
VSRETSDPLVPAETGERIERVYLVAFLCAADDPEDVPTHVGFIEGIRDGIPDEWFQGGVDSFRIERMVTDANWPLPPWALPNP